MEIGELYQRAVHVWTDRLGGVRDDQWDDPTPCTEWSVRDLVNHVVGEDAWTAPLVRGATIAEVGATLEGDLLGERPVDAASGRADEALAAVAERLPSGDKVHLSYGDEDMAEYLRQLVADHLVHGWDLAAATGGDRQLDPELVEAVADWFAGREEMYRSGGAIADRPDVAGGDPQTDLLAAFGRRTTWTPPRP